MNLETQETAIFSGLHGLPVEQREAQICEAAQSAQTAFEQISQSASCNMEASGDFQKRVFKIFRWYFLSAFCTRLLSESVHRLEHQTLQVSMDICSAVKMILSESDVEESMALVRVEKTSPMVVRANDIGARGHTVGWVAAGLHEKGRSFPGEIENALAGALAASRRLN
ncbi:MULTISPECIES: hypothetical protein [unclassified Ruegeria]|uniref:hypothetical protein n=1 Tax=unclassified Ruegeria TaxID=2625375 RepID=UPI001AD98EA1|nr:MULTISPECIES: hypothetical protein [unclassified Ruegeria]MBO9411327.1 hypothetical protein [Ruegeria sp. R8_1]MBO9416111.1 hypothetical protein [Ruegeria sp. R8_2]